MLSKTLPMKTITRILSEIISETFEKADPAAWKDAPAYRPGPVMVPVEIRKGLPRKK